jgi:hypothetical protein
MCSLQGYARTVCKRDGARAFLHSSMMARGRPLFRSQAHAELSTHSPGFMVGERQKVTCPENLERLPDAASSSRRVGTLDKNGSPSACGQRISSRRDGSDDLAQQRHACDMSSARAVWLLVGVMVDQMGAMRSSPMLCNHATQASPELQMVEICMEPAASRAVEAVPHPTWKI